MMYAMCNLHDVTWGTKGDNGSAKDLGGAKKVKDADGKELLEVELPTAREDVDSMWAASRASLRHPPPREKEHRDAATKLADHDRNSRTNVVLAWVGTNMLMIVFFTVCAVCVTVMLISNSALHQVNCVHELGSQPCCT